MLCRLLPSRLTSGNCQDLPSSRETLLTIRPALRPRRDRVRAMGPGVNVPDMAPAPKQNEGSSQGKFRGSITRLLVWLSTPRGDGLPSRHARLASGCWSQLGRAGFQPAGFLPKVSEWFHPSSFPELSWRKLGFLSWLNLRTICGAGSMGSRSRRVPYQSSNTPVDGASAGWRSHRC